MLFDLLRWSALSLGTFLILGVALSLSNSSHWFVRIWDFPRIQILTVLIGCVAASFWFHGGLLLTIFTIVGALTSGWLLYGIFRYTPLHPLQVKRATDPPEDSTFTLVATNVRMENEDHERWLAVMEKADPDLILAAEVDAKWERAMEPLREKYPHSMRAAQENYYGLVLLSRLPLIDPQVRFLVQDDIPSFHVWVELPNGSRFRLRGIHPRPPEPIRDQDSAPRDAELVMVGREVENSDEPTLIAGDLNDVAWSHTTRLFQRLSGTLDPRVGRGFINSFHAGHLLLRWPLDHIFHSEHFELVRFERLPSVGSDHFPILVELALAPRRGEVEQETPEPESNDENEADELLARPQG